MIEVEERYIEELKDKIRELKEESANLSDKLRLAEQDKEHLSFRIRNELEPRIKAEERAYDAYVLTDHAAEAADGFCGKVDELINFVKDNPNYFVWEDTDSDIYCMILYLIKLFNSDDLKHYCIQEKESEESTSDNTDDIEYEQLTFFDLLGEG